MKKLTLIALTMTLSLEALAFTECRMDVNKFWINASGSSIWICFEGQTCIYKTNTQVSDTALNRLFSAASLALTADRFLYVRFPEDNGNCATILNESRNDFVGFWVLDD